MQEAQKNRGKTARTAPLNRNKVLTTVSLGSSKCWRKLSLQFVMIEVVVYKLFVALVTSKIM